MLFNPKEKQKIFPLLKNKTLETHNPTEKNEMTEQIEKIKGILLVKRDGQLVRGGCSQWQDSALYDSVVHVKTVVLRGKYSVEPPSAEAEAHRQDVTNNITTVINENT